MEEVIFGLGANVGDPIAQLTDAVERLRRVVEVRAVSSVYRTEPMGYLDQPDFYNLAVVGHTRLEPPALLAETQQIERDLGRVSSFRNAPRIIDIDLLAWGERTEGTPELSLPHPRLHERAFVLIPLIEIAPEWRHPRLHRTASELLAALAAPGRVERIGPLRQGG